MELANILRHPPHTLQTSYISFAHYDNTIFIYDHVCPIFGPYRGIGGWQDMVKEIVFLHFMLDPVRCLYRLHQGWICRQDQQISDYFWFVSSSTQCTEFISLSTRARLKIETHILDWVDNRLWLWPCWSRWFGPYHHVAVLELALNQKWRHSCISDSMPAGSI